MSFFRLANQPFKDAKQGCWSPEKIAGPPFPFHFGVAARRGGRYVGRQKNGTKVGVVDVNTLPARQIVLNLYLLYFYLFSSVSLKRWMAFVVRGLRNFYWIGFLSTNRSFMLVVKFCPSPSSVNISHRKDSGIKIYEYIFWRMLVLIRRKCRERTRFAPGNFHLYRILCRRPFAPWRHKKGKTYSCQKDTKRDTTLR